ncbi:MAG: hypothetical protein F6K41_34360 [Symploca sp. SIO3E6]|nr:hypothetical protein [Caldora sp. SIO3E6]
MVVALKAGGRRQEAEGSEGRRQGARLQDRSKKYLVRCVRVCAAFRTESATHRVAGTIIFTQSP